MANEAQIESWDGPGGERWVRDSERYDRINERYGERLVAAVGAGSAGAAAAAGERVLDVGCGNGAVSLALAGAGAQVTGVDISGPMLAEAGRRASAAGLSIEFVKADAQVHAFEPAAFDTVVSRFGVMFFDDPKAAFANIGSAVRPGGRLLFACWQELLKNEWLAVPAVAALAHVPMPEMGEPGQPGPFAFAEPSRVQSILEAAGWVDVGFEEMHEPMVMGTSVDDTVAFLQGTDIAAGLFKDAEPAAVEAAWAAIADALAGHTRDDGAVVLQGAAWLVTASRP